MGFDIDIGDDIFDFGIDSDDFLDNILNKVTGGEVAPASGMLMDGEPVPGVQAAPPVIVPPAGLSWEAVPIEGGPDVYLFQGNSDPTLRYTLTLTTDDIAIDIDTTKAGIPGYMKGAVDYFENLYNELLDTAIEQKGAETGTALTAAQKLEWLTKKQNEKDADGQPKVHTLTETLANAVGVQKVCIQSVNPSLPPGASAVNYDTIQVTLLVRSVETGTAVGAPPGTKGDDLKLPTIKWSI